MTRDPSQSGLREVTSEDLTVALERAILPKLAARLRASEPGHCMRVSDLDEPLMVRLARSLRAAVPGSRVYVLRAEGGPSSEDHVTGTKLVELRNHSGPEAGPLLVFLPAEVRASAEDSFSNATFAQESVSGAYRWAREDLLSRFPAAVRDLAEDVLTATAEERWAWADPPAQVRFLLSLELNDHEPETLGASLFELGLVPDFRLHLDPAKVFTETRRNVEKARTILESSSSERTRALELGLSSASFQAELGDFLAEQDLGDPRGWTRRIVVDRVQRRLSFDKWTFNEGEATDAVLVEVTRLDLPSVSEDTTDPRLQTYEGQPYLSLGTSGARRLKVDFRVLPPPGRVPGLAKLSAQVVSLDRGPVGLTATKKAWARGEGSSFSFNRLDRGDWEEGWHFVRIKALTAAGDPIPLVDRNGNPVPWLGREAEPGHNYPHESELFYVLPDGRTDEPIEPRTAPEDASLERARLRLRLEAAGAGRDPSGIAPTRVGWVGTGPDAVLEVAFGREGSVRIPTSPTLRDLEGRVLRSPQGPSAWRLPIHGGEPGEPLPEEDRLGPMAAEFLAERRAYFGAVVGGSGELIGLAADLQQLREPALRYAEAYRRLLAELVRRVDSGGPEALTDLRRALGLDAVALTLRDHRGRTRDAALLGPTHPLKALWAVTWARVGEVWTAEIYRATERLPLLAPTREALFETLSAVECPPLLPLGPGRLFLPIGEVAQGWGLYAPAGEADPRGLLGEVRTALKLPEPRAGSGVRGTDLAGRVRRYLAQHPYVTTLAVNAFNPGRAGELAEMLLALERLGLEDLRYDLRLFVPDPDAPGVGASLLALLSPTATQIAPLADAFSTPTGDHLRPKLAMSVRALDEFKSRPQDHRAHLSVLFDVFPAAEVGVARPPLEESIAPVHGLIQDFSVRYEEHEDVVWRRSPRHGRSRPVDDTDRSAELLADLSRVASAAAAVAATGQTGPELWPTVSLALGVEGRAFLHQVHEASDWVLSVDRNLGIEYYDHGGRRQRPDYLIDHTPDPGGFGRQLVVTSRSIEELEAMMGPVLSAYGLDPGGGRAAAMLQQLRSLSGRTALKLLSAPNDQAEALGLALARLYLESQGVFADQIVLPLDAHLELYRGQGGGAGLDDELRLRRTDLALFDLDAEARSIICRLVEVKCYRGVGGLGAYQDLKGDIAGQIADSETALRRHFDPERSRPDLPSRPVKTRELAELLGFYLARAERYGLVRPAAAFEARRLLDTLEDGYRLAFTRSALIFDFQQPGTDPPEAEGGVEYHRIGVDVIHELTDLAASTVQTASFASVSQSSTLPKLRSAAFLAPERERTHNTTASAIPSPPGSPELLEPAPASALPPEEAAPKEAAEAGVEPPERPAVPHEGEADRAPDSTAAGPLAAPTPEAEGSAPDPVVVPPSYDVLLGASKPSPQYGLLGDSFGRRVALDLNETHTISLFGVQGGGKSYTLGAIAEMASMPISGVNLLPRPLGTVIFHYSPTQDYAPEFTSMAAPNPDDAQRAALRAQYGAEPRALSDVLLLAPDDKVAQRRAEYPGIEVRPLKFASAELQASHWRFLMGAVGNQSTYIRQIGLLMRAMRENLTLEGLRQGIEDAAIADHLKALAKARLELAAQYIDDSQHLGSLLWPGRLLIVDLRDEFIEKDEALGLFVVLLQLFADATFEGRGFNKLVVFDEAHKYIESPDLVSGLVGVIREMRHKGVSVLVASQDPPSVPIPVIELSSQIILHRFNSPAWLKHIQKANAALGGLTPERMAQLNPGEAYVWSSKATDDAFSAGTVKLRCRPRVTRHGGTTKTAT